MCCDPIELGEPVGSCPECGGDVDEEGYTAEYSCGYSPEVCKLCHWAPCDLSC